MFCSGHRYGYQELRVVDVQGYPTIRHNSFSLGQLHVQRCVELSSNRMLSRCLSLGLGPQFRRLTAFEESTGVGGDEVDVCKEIVYLMWYISDDLE